MNRRQFLQSIGAAAIMPAVAVNAAGRSAVPIYHEVKPWPYREKPRLHSIIELADHPYRAKCIFIDEKGMAYV